MNVFQLECFLAVADYLNFAKAAEHLHVSQPAVTHQIKTLEGELRVRLFRRTTRFVELTTEGLAFLEDARNIVSISRRAVKRFENDDDQAVLSLSLGCDSRFLLELLPAPLGRLRELYPNLHPRVSLLPGKHLLPRVEDGALDAALSVRDSSLGKDKLLYRHLRQVGGVCLCPPDHPFAARDAVSLEEVLAQPLILYHPQLTVPEVSQVQWRLLESKKPSELFFCESPEAAVLLTRAGYGVSVLPDILSQPVPDLAKCRLADLEPLSFGVYHRPEPDAPQLRDFLRLLREYSL